MTLFVIVAVAGFGLGWFALPALMRWYAVSYAVTSRRVLFREGRLSAGDLSRSIWSG